MSLEILHCFWHWSEELLCMRKGMGIECWGINSILMQTFIIEGKIQIPQFPTKQPLGTLPDLRKAGSPCKKCYFCFWGSVKKDGWLSHVGAVSLKAVEIGHVFFFCFSFRNKLTVHLYNWWSFRWSEYDNSGCFRLHLQSAAKPFNFIFFSSSWIWLSLLNPTLLPMSGLSISCLDYYSGLLTGLLDPAWSPKIHLPHCCLRY